MKCKCGCEMSRVEYSFAGDTRNMGDWDEILWACNSADCNLLCFEDTEYYDWYDLMEREEKKKRRKGVMPDVSY